jgi:hypothetical protein
MVKEELGSLSLRLSDGLRRPDAYFIRTVYKDTGCKHERFLQSFNALEWLRSPSFLKCPQDSYTMKAVDCFRG